jgi:REP element-mobilizing transposase RayT
LGQTAETEWVKSVGLRPDMKLELGVFVVMPNHFHAIIMIGKNIYNTQRRDAMHCVSTTNATAPNNPNNKNKFGPQYKNLSSIIRGFKSSVTTNSRKIGNTEFAWQSRFHDHIIRDRKSFERIQNYILNNPKNWKEDIFNSKKT